MVTFYGSSYSTGILVWWCQCIPLELKRYSAVLYHMSHSISLFISHSSTMVCMLFNFLKSQCRCNLHKLCKCLIYRRWPIQDLWERLSSFKQEGLLSTTALKTQFHYAISLQQKNPWDRKWEILRTGFKTECAFSHSSSIDSLVQICPILLAINFIIVS